MPHMILKITDDLTEENKEKLLNAFAEDMIQIAGKKPEEISIQVIKVSKENWQKVYDQDVMPNLDLLDRKPGYTM